VDDEVQPEASNDAGADAPPDEVTRDLFLVWRWPRIGLRNPQRMTNPVWSWLARRPELSAYTANARFGGPSSLLVGPGWCAQRHGQSSTRLPDGRVIEVGGEHEDFYDPDFFIYNDVIVRPPAGALEIYGYPHEVFPPTDFHSATWVGGRIVIVGGLRYGWMRTPGRTTVYALDPEGLAIAPVPTTGDAPGWIYDHEAALADDGATLVLRGGKRAVDREGGQAIVENIDDWALDLARGVWSRLTDRRWAQWELARADGRHNDLFEIGSGAWYADGSTEFDREQLARPERSLGRRPDFALHAERYAPPVPHARLEDEEAWNVTRIVVDGVTVRYREESTAVHLRIEGALPDAVAAAIVEDARGKLEALEQTAYVARPAAG
jgi:hypothetical protein